jgi:hypothetical protein
MYFLLLSILLLFASVTCPRDYERIINFCFEKINKTKDILTPYLIDIGYKLIYGFSVCEIQFNKVKNLLVTNIKFIERFLIENNIITKKSTQIIRVLNKNGIIQDMGLISNITDLKDISSIFDPVKHSALLLYDKNVETGCVNKVFFTEYPKTFDYDVSNVKFIMVEIEYENSKYCVELKNDLHNYYIVNNSLNQNFFKYYLKNILNVVIKQDNFDYVVTIIDHNVNVITLLPHQDLIFDKNGYTIHPLNIESKTSDTIMYEPESNSDTDKSEDFVKLESDS